jgi:hypothetical protein
MPGNIEDDHNELVAQVVATRAFAIHHAAVIFFALAEKGAIDAPRVLAFSEGIASGFEQMAKLHASEPIRSRVHALTAESLREFEATIRNMATVPAGAGRA